MTASQYLELIDLNGPALVAAGALALGASLVGVFVLLRRDALLALALPQAVAVGAAIGFRMQSLWPIVPALLAAGAALGIIAWARARRADHVLLPTLYVGGLSLSVLVIANAASYLHEVQHLLSGADVFVTDAQAKWAACVLVPAGLLCALLWRRWLLLAQNPTAARLAGLRPALWDALFLVLLALVVVLGTSTSGILMVLALLVLPGAAVLPWVKRIPPALLASVGLALVFVAIGFVLSIEMEWPLSQSVGGVGFVAVIVSHLVRGRS